MVAFRQTIKAFLMFFVAFFSVGGAAPVEDFFKTAHREAWNVHLSRIVNDSNSPKWVKTGYADGKFETSIWEYIPDVAFDYSTKTEGYFKSDDWVSLDKLDEAITENLNRAACREKDVYECYSGSNWNALLF
ncbi:MAG: hypothetical protein IJ599_01025, partial [Alphaproteobacteria bacterium]|nr:hypothetical protein [Alphaproteobacteria bacterium]